MAFGDIPIRENGKDFLVSAEWWNSIRTELIAAFGTGGYIKVANEQTIAAGGEIVVDPEAFKPLIPIKSTGGAVVISNTAFGVGHGFQAGKEIILLGTSDTDTVTLELSDIAEGTIAKGKIVLTKYEQVILIYNEVLQRFIRKY